MEKKQEQHYRELFPIQQDILDANFAALGQYDTDDIQLLKTIWMDDSLDGNPSHELLLLTTRSELQEHDQQRRSYRAGVLIGTIIMRHQLTTVGGDTHDQQSSLYVSAHDFAPSAMSRKLSRYALSQFFDSQEPVDIATHLAETLEADWLRNHNSFQPEKNDTAPKNDWLAVGLGDTLALYGSLYEIHAGRGAPSYKTKPLVEEPGITLARKPIST